MSSSSSTNTTNRGGGLGSGSGGAAGTGPGTEWSTSFFGQTTLPTMTTTNQAEYDLLMLEINERSVRFLDAKPAVRNFFMRIDSIYYERDKSPHYYTEQPLNSARDPNGGGTTGTTGAGISISKHFKNKDKNWFSRSVKLEQTSVVNNTSSVQNHQQSSRSFEESEDPRFYELSSPSLHDRHFAGFKSLSNGPAKRLVPFHVILSFF